MDILLWKKAAAWISLRKLKGIAHDDFSVCSLNTKSFYHFFTCDFVKKFNKLLNLVNDFHAINLITLLEKQKKVFSFQKVERHSCYVIHAINVKYMIQFGTLLWGKPSHSVHNYPNDNVIIYAYIIQIRHMNAQF